MIAEPFVGLRPFESDDAAIFFGRERETEILVNLIYSSGAVVVFAPSGTGKSSLLRAGVLPALRQEMETIGPVLLFSDWRVDVVPQIRRGMVESDPQLAAGGEAPSLFYLFQDHRIRTGQRAVIILDQLEELFRERRDLGHTWDELAPIVNATRSPASMVLCIREDYLGLLNDLMKRAPGLMSARFRVDPPTPEVLHDAVVGPLAALEPPFTAEPALITRFIEDLQRDAVDHIETSVEPGYLQIVWSRLWEVDRDSPDHAITLRTYKSERGVRGILAGFMDRTIDQLLSDDQKELLYGVIRYMVPPAGAKIAMGVDDLAGLLREEDLTDRARADTALLGRLGLSARSQLDSRRQVLDELLTRLTGSDAPVFRRVERGQRVEFQLRHDLLGKILLQWRDRIAIVAGLQLREQLDRAQHALRDSISPQQIQLRDELWSEIQKAQAKVKSPTREERAIAADALGFIAKRATGVFPSVRGAAEEALDQLTSDNTSLVQKAARRAVENLHEIDAMPTVQVSVQPPAVYPFRFGLRGETAARRLLFFTQFYGLLILSIVSVGGADLITRELFPATRGLDYPIYRLVSACVLVVVWLSLYAYDTLDNSVPWFESPLRRVMTPLLRPRSMGVGFFEQISVWPANFLLPALIGNGLGELTASFGTLPFGYLLGLWVANILMWVAFNRAAAFI